MAIQRFFLLFCFFCIAMAGLKAQRPLAMEHKTTGKLMYIRAGATIWVQTFDDPPEFYSKVKFVAFDGVNFTFSDFSKNRKQIQVPLKDISSFVMNRPLEQRLLKGLLITGASILTFSGIALLGEGYEGLFIILPSVPILVASLQIKAKRRFYVPNYEFYTP